MTDGNTRLTAALAGRYTLERELGAGGMATVYLARDLKHDRDVAIKVLKPDPSQSLGAERFLAEIRTTARLRHAHILPLFDSGEADGLLFYVMPVVEGESLRARLDRDGPLPIDDALRIAREVGDALGYAHTQGIIHRDIKPENILLERGHALVADFGIAHAMDAGDARMTQTGMSLGTPLYMSPEQSAGDDVDARSDLYSLASVLYEMLTGEPPFSGATGQAVLVQRFTKAPPRPKAKRAQVNERVDVAVYCALARDPVERPASVERFVAMLAESPAPSTAVPKSIAVLPFENLSSDKENEYFGDGVAEEIINALAQVEGLKVAARTSAFSFKGKREDLRSIGEKLGVATVLEGSVRKAGSRIRITAQLIAVADGYHLWSERYDRELLDVFAVQDEIAMAIAAKLHVTFVKPTSEHAVDATSALVEAFELCTRGRGLMMQRGRSLLEAIACFERATELAPGYAPAFAGLGDAHGQAARYGLGDVADHLRRFESAIDRALAIDPDFAEALAIRGGTGMAAAIGKRDVNGGLVALDRALAINPRLSDNRVVLAFGLIVYRDDDVRGLAEAERAVRDDPLSGYAGMMRALMLGLVKRHGEARAEAERAFALDPASYLMHYTRVWVRVMAGDMTGASEAIREALPIFGRDEAFLGVLPVIFLAQGERRKAEAVHAELLARAETARVHPFSLAVSAFMLGRADEGMAYALASADEGSFQPLFWMRGYFAELASGHPQYAELRRRVMA